MTLVDVNTLSGKTLRIACIWVIKRMFYMIIILLNLNMILHIIIMREANMVVEIFLLLNYLSSYWDWYYFFLLPCLCLVSLALIICLLIKRLCTGSMLDLNVFVTCFMMLSLCFNSCLSCEHQWNFKAYVNGYKERACWETTQ